jgi:H+/gluconate symporter-like permease
MMQNQTTKVCGLALIFVAAAMAGQLFSQETADDAAPIVSQPDATQSDSSQPALSDPQAADPQPANPELANPELGDLGSAETAAIASDTVNSSTATASTPKPAPPIVLPMICLGVGIATVLGLIIVLKVNAFIALISAAMIVSLIAPGEIAEKISRVAAAFGGSAGGIGIVIAMAAVIGKCMLDSGAADRIVRTFLKMMGEKGAPMALMGSGFVLAIPVFFDTVFYLLVPLARSLHKRTKRNYLLYIMAIGAGGAITHTLVPPTPGPLMMASNLGISVGMMMMIGALVGIPPAIVGVLWAMMIDKRMDVPMRPVANEVEPDPLADEELPSMFLSLLPVLLPVVLIAANTVMNYVADNQHAALLKVTDVKDWPAFTATLREEISGSEAAPAQRIVATLREGAGDVEERQTVVALIEGNGTLSAVEQEQLIEGLNRFVLPSKTFHRGDEEDAFVGVVPNATARKLLKKDRLRMEKAYAERMNRSLLESVYPGLIGPHVWDTRTRYLADWSKLFGNANLVLLLSTVIALWLVVRQRGLSKTATAGLVETALMSGGVIILITAGGGAFGAMLKEAQIGPAIQALLGGSGGGGESSQLALLFLAFVFGSMLKIAQGSGTVAMIVGTSMIAAIVAPLQLEFSAVYLACAVGAGSLVCSWMNDSGFWIFAKMGGLTEMEALKSWTVMLVVLGLVTFATTVALSFLLPLA